MAGLLNDDDRRRGMAIVQVVADMAKLTVESVISRDGRRYIAATRRTAMLSLSQSGFSHMAIAELMDRDPCTVKDAITKAKKERNI